MVGGEVLLGGGVRHGVRLQVREVLLVTALRLMLCLRRAVHPIRHRQSDRDF